MYFYIIKTPVYTIIASNSQTHIILSLGLWHRLVNLSLRRHAWSAVLRKCLKIARKITFSLNSGVGACSKMGTYPVNYGTHAHKIPLLIVMFMYTFWMCWPTISYTVLTSSKRAKQLSTVDDGGQTLHLWSIEHHCCQLNCAIMQTVWKLDNIIFLWACTCISHYHLVFCWRQVPHSAALHSSLSSASRLIVLK